MEPRPWCGTCGTYDTHVLGCPVAELLALRRVAEAAEKLVNAIDDHANNLTQWEEWTAASEALAAWHAATGLPAP